MTVIARNTLSSSLITAGVKPDGDWIQKNTGSTIAKPVKQSWWQSFMNGFKNTLSGVMGLFAKIPILKTGDGLEKAVTGLIKWGSQNKAVVTTTVSAVAAVGTLFAMNQVGVDPAGLIRNLLNFGEFTYNFNFDVSDKQLWDSIKAQINSLYGPAGELVGGSLARLIILGTFTPPKVEINVRALAINFECCNQEIQEELLENISMFAHQGMYVARYIAFAFAFMQGRQSIKQMFAKNGAAIPIINDGGQIVGYKQLEGNNQNRIALKKANPGLLKKIDEWGDENVEDWRMSTYVENKVESIPDERIRNFVEGFLEGFWEAFRESIEMVYN